MRKLTSVGVAGAIALAIAAPAGASRPVDTPAADRACLGTFHSSLASPAFAEFVPFIAETYQPLGEVVSYEATTCDLVFD
jgi:hypothetical protein